MCLHGLFTHTISILLWFSPLIFLKYSILLYNDNNNFLLWNIIVNQEFSMVDKYQPTSRLVYTVLSLSNPHSIFAFWKCLLNFNSETCGYSKSIVNWTSFCILLLLLLLLFLTLPALDLICCVTLIKYFWNHETKQSYKKSP